MTDRVLNLARMARRIGVTQIWLRGEANAGRIPALRAGRRLLFEPEAVEEAIAKRAGTATQPSRSTVSNARETGGLAALIAILIGSRRARDRDGERVAKRRLEEEYGIRVTFVRQNRSEPKGARSHAS